MNIRKLFVAVTAMAVMAAPFAQAADGTWTLNNNGNWSATNNWSSGTVAEGTGFTATFGNVITDNRTVTLDAPYTIGNITASDTDKNYTISGANMLTLDGSASVSVIDVTTSGRTLTISSPVTMNSGLTKNGAGVLTISTGGVTLGGTQTWTNNSAGSVTVSGTVDNGGYTITVDNSTIITLSGVISGAGGIVKNGAGRVNLGAVVNTYTGVTTINNGILQIGNNSAALGSGNLTINDGTFNFYWSAGLTRTLGTGDNQVQILGGLSGFGGDGATGPTINLGTTVKWGTVGEGATGFFNPSKFVLGSFDTGNSGSTTFSSGIDLNGATRTIVVPKGVSSAGNRTTISGAISNSGGTAGLIKEGDGFLFLTNNSSTWDGTTTVSGGILDFGGISLANIGGGSGRNITVAAGAVVRFNALSNTILNRIVETTDEIGIMTGGTANNLDFSSSTGANLPSAFLGNYAGNGAKCEYNGTLTVGGANYNLGALGSSGLLGMRQPLTGDHGLIIGQTGSTGLRINIVAANTFTGDTVITSGNRLTLGNNLALQNSVLDVGSAGGNFSCAAGTNSGRITGETEASSPTFGGLKGSRSLISVFSSSAGNNETNLGASSVTNFTLNVAVATTNTYSGAIGGFGAGASGSTGGNSSLTKTGPGTQILAGANTYAGMTVVSEGVLDVRVAASLGNCSGIQIAYDVATLRLENADNGGNPWNLAALTVLNATLTAGPDGPANELKFTVNGDYTDITAQFIPAGTLIQLK